MILGGLVFVVGGDSLQSRRLAGIRGPYGRRFFAGTIGRCHLGIRQFLHFPAEGPGFLHSEFGCLVT